MTAKFIEAYKKAAEHLLGNKTGASYRANQENGRIYLYEAYRDALKEKNKDHLWYARILFMMYEYHRGRYSEQMLFYCFLEEAYHEYKLALSENAETERNEMEQIEYAYKRSKQYIEMQSCRKSRHNELREIIGGMGLPEELVIFGSRIISFRHDMDSAILKLDSSNTVTTFRFSEIYEITADLTPPAAWISDIVCSKYPDSKAVRFDIGLYKILCAKIEVVDISENDSTSQNMDLQLDVENSR